MVMMKNTTKTRNRIVDKALGTLPKYNFNMIFTFVLRANLL